MAKASGSPTDAKVVNKTTKEASLIPNPARLIGINEITLTIAIMTMIFGIGTKNPAEENKR